MAIVSAVPTVIMILKVRSEEKKGLNEHIISRNVSRIKLLNGYFIISLISSFSMMFLIIFGLWGSIYAVMPDSSMSFMELFKSGMVYLPAIWVMIGMALVLIAYLPRFTSFIWVMIGYSVFAVYLGMLLGLPDWINKLTPFGYIPQIPSESMNWNNLIVLSGISIVLFIFGFIGYRKREIQAS